MAFREITPGDLPLLPALLSEGFPATRPEFWFRALDVLDRRPPVEGLPRYGLVLEAEGGLHAVMLMLSQMRGTVRLCNLSSWYVRASHRGYASFMLAQALKAKDVTWLDCSPTPPVVPMIEKLGFEPYTGGSVLLDARASVRRGPAVGPLRPGTLETLEAAERERIEANLHAGCRGLVAQGTGEQPLLYRVARVKRHVPVARFVYGAPEVILAHAGAIARHLLARGIPLALVDRPVGVAVPLGREMPGYGVRYCRGDAAPPVGDLLDTEYALFGI